MNTLDSREILEGLKEQGRNESIVWKLQLTPAPVSLVGVYVYDEADLNTDIAVSHLTGSGTVSSPYIYLPNLHSLVLDHTYRVEVLYSDGTSTLETFLRVKCTR